MRTTVIAMGLAIGLVAGQAGAQSAVEGPLAAPGAAPAVSKATISAKPKRRKPAKAAQHRAAPQADGMNYGAGIPIQGQAAQARLLPSMLDSPASPVDFGMKWNGNNDTARETRVQNYNGDAQGTGAEVGMKLHF